MGLAVGFEFFRYDVSVLPVLTIAMASAALPQQ